jgi:hypothetical protein
MRFVRNADDTDEVPNLSRHRRYDELYKLTPIHWENLERIKQVIDVSNINVFTQ